MEYVEQRLNELGRRIDDGPAGTQQLGREEGTPEREAMRDPGQQVGATSRSGFRFAGIEPFVGTALGNELEQVVVGVRGRYGTDREGALRYMPELAVGFGDGTFMYNANLNLALPIPSLASPPILPYVGLGAGVLGFSEAPVDEPSLQAIVNVLLGTEIGSGASRLVVEYAGLDLFNFSRIRIGFRIGL